VGQNVVATDGEIRNAPKVMSRIGAMNAMSSAMLLRFFLARFHYVVLPPPAGYDSHAHAAQLARGICVGIAPDAARQA
jgi:hypothetical protein